MGECATYHSKFCESAAASESLYTAGVYTHRMESLAVLVESMAAHIRKYRGRMRKNERLVRHALVNPVLRELGWNPEDPKLVEAGYRFRDGSVDYALLQGKKPIAAVRTVRLGGPLRESLDDLAAYKVRYHIATDGRLWLVRRTADQAPESDLVEFDLTGDPVSECPKMEVIWRRSMSKTSKKAGHRRLGRSGPAGGLVPLPDLVPGQVPTELVFPDGASRRVKSGKSMMIEVAQWLLDGGRLSGDDCPIILSEKRYLLAREPVHPTKKSFISGKHVGDLHLETNFNSRRILDNIGVLISRAGLDAGDFSVRLP